MTIGERIRDRRIELDMTQEELAKKLGYKSRSSINKIELMRDLPLKKVAPLAKALLCEPGYLMGWEEVNAAEQGAKDFELLDKISRLSESDRMIIENMVDRMLKSGV